MPFYHFPMDEKSCEHCNVDVLTQECRPLCDCMDCLREEALGKNADDDREFDEKVALGYV